MCKRTIVSESVTNGHPDKIADWIADSILEEYSRKDRKVRAGIEVMVKDNVVVLGGEINSNAIVDYETIVRDVFRKLSFPASHHLEPENIKIVNLIGKQSEEIHSGVDKSDDVIGAGDQGFVCGFATNETPAYLGLGHYISKKICRYIEKEGGLGPDAKSQVVVEYDDEGNAEIKSVLISTMHNGIFDDLEETRQYVSSAFYNNLMNIDADIFEKYINGKKVPLTVNPCGAWHIGGPVSDCGVTGRKIVVDQFGGYSKVGGGALSGKEMTKVDRSGAYMARYLAKNIVASGISDTAEVELSYMIGVPEPSSVYVSLGNNCELQDDVIEAIKNNVDLTPAGIIKRFGYCEDRYEATGRFGHYGVVESECNYIARCYELYPWEKTDIKNIFSKLKK